MLLKIFCDGGARGNPGPAAIGFIVTDPTDHPLHQHSEVIGSTTNNVAEYRAVISALEWLLKNKSIFNLPARPLAWSLFTLNFYLDSTLVVNQLNGLFKIKQAHLRDLLIQVRSLEQSLQLPITYTVIPRSHNAQADALVNQALDSAGF